MELPVELVALLSSVVGFAVAEGLRSLSRLLGRDLSGQGAALTAAVVSLLVASLNGALALIPPEYAIYVRGLLSFLVIVLVPLAVHDILKRKAG